jgi:hypothetical protein
MVKLSESDIEPRILSAVVLFAHEGVSWYRELLATPVGGDYPPAAPWPRGNKRMETALGR